MKEIILKILNAGVRAPSGDNSQPWRFEVKDNIIKIYNLSEKDNPIFNYKQRGSYVAHGALIENIVIAAKEYGFDAKISLFPEGKDKDCVAELVLEEKTLDKDSLFSSIFKRAINRKPYKDDLLKEEQKNEILNTVKEIGKGSIILVEDKEKKKILGEAFAVNEVVMLENQQLHKYFFSDVRWTDEEEREYKTGLYARTMELQPPQLMIFKILSHWRINKFLCKLGIAKFIAKENSKGYSTGSAMGAIIMEDESPESYIFVGRIMQRIWLKATKMGLGFHPLTGVVYMMMRIRENSNEVLSLEHVERLKKAYANIQNSFGIEKGVITITFRIGDGGEPSGYSSRLEPNVTFIS